jgi:hypothetical protein
MASHWNGKQQAAGKAALNPIPQSSNTLKKTTGHG